MNFIEYDSTSKIVEFEFPNLEELDTITDDLVKQVKYWLISRPSDTNGNFDIGIIDNDIRVPSYNEKLYIWLNECLAQASKFYFPKENLKFAISDSWMTRSDSGTTASSHIHQSSHLSGILYLTDNNSQTIFEIIPRELEVLSHPLGYDDFENIKVQSVKGKLIIFPSRIRHRVRVLPGQKNTRYTYIFNSFATGLINPRLSAYLEYTVKDIKDRYLEYISKP